MRTARFARYAVGVLVYNLGVIVWGAYVRASGSGAGCGSHWPSCQGDIIPRAPSIETLVEYSHRVTSGLALLSVLGLVFLAWRIYENGHPIRRAAITSLVFMLTEALIGAGLVLFEYVAENKSIARAFWMSGHLINTFLLLAALTTTAWLAFQRVSGNWRIRSAFEGLPLAAMIGAVVLGVSGAVTALGGTLFPVTSLAEGLRLDLSPASHVLIRLRFYHPLLAVAVGVLLIFVAMRLRAGGISGRANRPSTMLVALVLLQLGAGSLNLLLHAPIWLQLVHLLLSDLIWIALLLLALEVRAEGVAVASPANQPAHA